MTWTINYKGVTGVVSSIVIDETTATAGTVYLAITNHETGNDLVTYGNVFGKMYLTTNSDIELSAIMAGGHAISDKDVVSTFLTNGCTILAQDADNGAGVSRETRQQNKLLIAQMKKKATMSANPMDEIYYRARNTYDDTALPTKFSGNAVVDNPNPDGLLLARPWIVSSGGTTITEAVDADTLIALQVWYDAADLTTYIPSNPSDGSTFTQWTDKSNYAHNANPEGGATVRPTVQLAEQNNRSVVRFDGINDVLSVNPFTDLANAAHLTGVVVARFNNTTGGQRIFNSNEGGFRIGSDGTKINVNVAGGGGTVPSTLDTNWHIMAIVFDGAETGDANRLKFRFDGTQETITFTSPGVNTTTLSTATELWIGAQSGGSQYFNGDIAELVVFTQTLTTGELQNVETYLSQKWNITI